ncbi:rhodanese-like domain-containing protein [Austwickia chelonae]|uniref:rhodanese-like domain-containing protein n=1 Tax=Austwickia chelonae TaxID=100225 RepID=UPI000E257675|nr:rhodanese-like domain-containing protein [Austwickia chelonae]
MRECTLDDLAQAHAEAATVVDVREPNEYAAGHVPGAITAPLSRLADHLSEIPSDGVIYVICASGNRSKAATTLLMDAGHDAVSVQGGTNGWVQLGRPVVQGMSRR